MTEFEAAVHINLGDFCGLTPALLTEFINSIHEAEEVPCYNYINMLTKGRGKGQELKDLFENYSKEKYAHKYTYLYEKVTQKIDTKKVTEVLYFPYKNNKSTLLSLSYAKGLPFLQRVDENTKIEEYQHLFDMIENRNPIHELQEQI